MNERIAQLIWEGDVLRFGHYTNASGGTFPLLPDPRLLFTNPRYLKVLGEELGKLIRAEFPSVHTVAGASTAGISLATAVALETGLEFVYVRKEGKGYAGNQTVEGKVHPGMEAIIVDDFSVKGKGKNILIENLWANGIGCRSALTVLDCECPMVPWYQENQVIVRWLLTVSDIFRWGLAHGKLSRELYDLVWDVYKDDNFLKWSPEQEKWKAVMASAKQEGFTFLGE